MLSIEYAHKRIRPLPIELSLIAVACLGIMQVGWQLLLRCESLNSPLVVMLMLDLLQQRIDRQ